MSQVKRHAVAFVIEMAEPRAFQRGIILGMLTEELGPECNAPFAAPRPRT